MCYESMLTCGCWYCHIIFGVPTDKLAGES